MNRYAYYALKCEQGGYAYTKAIDGLSFCGGSLLTFSCDFYYDKGFSGALFSQKGSVLGEIKNGSICWTLNNGTALKTDSSKYPLWEDAWNHLDVVYSTEKITMYINRVPAAEKSIGEKQDASAENMVIGEEYPGYIRSVRIADFAFSQDDIFKNCVQNQVEKEKLHLHIPFDEFEVKDQGKNGLTVICFGLARVTTLVGAISFSGSGFAAVHDKTLNPGTAGMPEFTIVTRVFLYPGEQENSVLYENVSDQADGFALKLNQTTDGAYLALEAADFKYQEKDIPLANFEWQVLCVTVKDKQVNCYVNGELIKTLDMPKAYLRTSSPGIYFGDHTKGGKSINGSIDYFAIYEQCLSAESAAEISRVEPYIYDDKIVSLYLLHGEGLHDMVGDGSLSLSGCEQKLLEGTVFESKIEPFTFRADDEFPGNEFELWEADTLLKLYLPVISQMNGMPIPENIPGSIKWKLLQEVSSIQMVQDIFSDYDDLEDVEIEDLFETVGTPVLGGVMASVFAAGLGFASYMGYKMEKMLEECKKYWFVLFLPFIAYIADKIIEAWEDDDPPIPPIPWVPTFGYRAELQSVQFCVEKNGSLPLRRDFDNPQVLPEWTSETAKDATMAYLAKSQKPSIEVKFDYIPSGTMTLPQQIILYGKGDLFGNFQTEPVTCMAAGTYSTTATLDSFQVTEDTLPKCYENNIKWSYNAQNGVKTFMQATGLKTHIIKFEPLYPWSLTDKNHYPTIELLELADKIFKSIPEGVKDETAFLEALQKYLGTDAKPEYSPQQQYTSETACSVTDIDVHHKGLVSALKQQGSKLGSLDASAAAMYIAAMEGWKMQVIGFYSYEYPVNDESEVTIGSCGFWLNELEAWGKAITDEAVRHFTTGFVHTTNAEDIVIYDLVWNLKGSPERLNGLNINDYCSKVSKGDSFGLGMIGYRVIENENTVPKKLGISYDAKNGVFETSDRIQFRKYVRDKFNFSTNKACCHRLSYKYLEEFLVWTFNHFKEEDKKDLKDRTLNQLYDIFYADNKFVAEDAKNKRELSQAISRLKAITHDDLQNDDMCFEAQKQLQKALLCMNSALINLRPGYSNWNSSIGYNYDPERYYIYFRIFDLWYRVNHKGEIQCVIEMYDPRAEDIEGGIYLLTEQDKRIWDGLNPMMSDLEYDMPIILAGYREAYVTVYGEDLLLEVPYAYSSNNEIDFYTEELRSEYQYVYTVKPVEPVKNIEPDTQPPIF